MQRTESKNPRLKARVEALDRELARIDQEISVISRAAEHPDREAAMRRLQRLAAEQERTREMQVSRSSARAVETERDRMAEPPPDEPQRVGAAGTVVPETFSRGNADPRFANYFVTGGLHSIRPLRQERRVQRNKAIFMLILAIALMYGVLSLIF